MIIKKVPGAGEVQMVYDSRDRLVMVQDGFQASNNFNWLCTVYDELNRPIKTFIYEWDESRETIQGDVNNDINLVPSFLNSYSTLLTQTYYDNYSWASGITGISSTLDNSFTSSADYISSSNTSPYYAQAFTASTATRGMVTGSKIRILGTNNFVYSLTLYDDKGRPIQTQSTNHTGGTDIVSTQYDFSGKALRTHHKHIRNSGGTPIQIATVLSYDAMGRLLNTKKRINSGALKTIAVNTYNATGQLQTKELGNNPATNTPLETLDYSYNIRGWLTGINKPYANSGNENDESRKFGMELNYDYGFTQNQFNGNIAGIKWKSTGSNKQRAYGFDYDNANRLLKGDFTQIGSNTGIWDQSDGINYDMKMGDGINYNTAYDANGNILRMQQWGLKLTTSSQIDNLTYTYNSNSNKLKNVIDANNDSQTKLGDFRYSPAYNTALGSTKTTAATDYDYDANGNLVYDKNKDIGSITYNHLNLPVTIAINSPSGVGGGKGTISYTYDAAGNKLKKVTVESPPLGGGGAKTTTTYYVSGFVYEQVNSNPVTLQFFGHEEGRIREQKDANGTVTGYVFDYMIKDHLGNVRMVLTDEQKQDVYHASFEDQLQNFESQLFNNYNNIVNKPNCFERSTVNLNQWYDGIEQAAKKEEAKAATAQLASFDYVEVLDFLEEKADKKLQVVGAAKVEKPMVVGAGKVLKVMAGDHVNANVYGWYSREIQNVTAPNNLTPIKELLLSFFGGGISSMSESGGAINGNNGLLASGIEQFLRTQENYNEDGAYLNWILLDEEQLKLVQSGSGFESFMKGVEGQDGCASTILKANNGEGIEVKKNGYLYIYVSNTNKHYPVYFDDLHIEHIRGSLTEETHYYPFGLTMNGISSKAATNAPANKEKTFQGQRFDDELGLDWVQFKWRNHDVQIGRFIEVDPLSEKYQYNSTYAFSENKVTNHIELEGLEAVWAGGDPNAIKLVNFFKYSLFIFICNIERGVTCCYFFFLLQKAYLEQLQQ
jgi:RHS repeat-associated protein